MGTKLTICTDAHSTAQLDYMRFGVAQARRGWLARGDVLNSRPWGDVETLLRRH
jgi:DNA polymerase (family 10)